MKKDMLKFWIASAAAGLVLALLLMALEGCRGTGPTPTATTAFRLRTWLAAGLIALGAWVLGCRLEERTVDAWYPIPEWEPPFLEDVLLWNGLRYLVGIRARDGQYYGLHEAAPFLATHWAWIDSAPGDEDGEGEA